MNAIRNKCNGLVFFIGATFLMPGNNVGYLALIAMLVISLWQFPRKLMKHAYFAIFAFFMSFMLNLHYLPIYYKDILTFSVIFLLVFTQPQNKYNDFDKNKAISTLFFIMMFGIVLFSQVVMLLHISPFDGIFRQLYVANDLYDFDGSLSEMLSSAYYRASGFLGNPNQCAKFCNLLLCFYLYYLPNNSRPSLIVLAEYVSIIVLAGSRTGMIVSLLILLVFFYLRSSNRLKFLRHTIIITIFVILFIFPVLSYLRLFNFEEAVEYSLLIKLGVVGEYVNYSFNNVFDFIFGNFFVSSSLSLLKNESIFSFSIFDSDLGYIYYSYGLLGIIALIVGLKNKYKLRIIPVIFFSLFFWCISASIFMHFKFILLFYFMILYCEIGYEPIVKSIK